MKLLLKFVLLAVFLLIVLAIGALVAIPVFFDPNDHKERIVEKVQAQTGRKFELAGDIELTWYPWLGLTVAGVTLGNAPGFEAATFFHGDLLQARVKLLPLLRKQIEMDTIRVHGLVLNLEVDAEGTSNWSDLAQAPDEPERGYQPIDLAALAIGGVDVRDAQLSFSNRQTGAAYRVQELNANTGELVLGEPIELAVTAKFDSAKPALEGDLALAGTVAYDSSGERFTLDPFRLSGEYRGPNVPGGRAELSLSAAAAVDLDAGTLEVSGLEFATLDTSITGHLAGRNVDTDEPAVQAELAVAGRDMATLFRVAEIEALAQQIARLEDPSFDLKAKLDADMKTGRVALSDLSLKLLGAAITGHLDATDAHTDTPALTGKLNASGPDLPTLLQVAGQFQGGPEPALARMGRALAGNPNKAFDLSTSLDADLKAGTMNVPQLEAKLLGATISGRVAGTRIRSGKPALAGELQARGADLPALLVAAGYLQGGEEPALAEIGRKLASARDKSFELGTRFDLDLDKGNIDLPELAARGAGLDISGNLAARDFGGSRGRIDGKLEIRSDAPGPLLVALDQAELAQVVQSLTANAGIKGQGQAFTLAPLALKAVLAGKEIPNSPVTLALTTSARADLDAQTAALSDLSVTGLGLNVKGDLQATRILDAPAFSGNVAVAPFNLRALLRQLNQEVPRTADPQVLRKVALSTDLEGSADSLSLSKLALTLDDTRLQGDLVVNNFADPDIRFGIDIDRLDADRYLPPKTEGKPGAPPSPEAAAAGAAQLPIDTLRKLKVAGRLTIGELRLSGARMNDVQVTINARDGRLAVDPTTARLYQGAYRGKVSLDARAAQPRLAVNTVLDGVQLGPLLKDYAGNDKLEGTGNVTLDLTATGADTDTIVRTLNGTGNLDVRNGIVHGIDAQEALRQAEIIFETKSVGRISSLKQQGGSTPFERLAATLNVKNGVVFNEDLTLTAPGLVGRGEGMLANLVLQEIKYKIEVAVQEDRAAEGDSTYNIGGYAIPIRCAGSLNDLSSACKPDYGKFVQEVASKAVGEKLQDKLGDVLGLPKKQAPQQPAQEQTAQPQPQQPAAPASPEDAVKDALKKGLKGLFD